MNKKAGCQHSTRVGQLLKGKIGIATTTRAKNEIPSQLAQMLRKFYTGLEELRIAAEHPACKKGYKL
jgi:hypothetical protein